MRASLRLQHHMLPWKVPEMVFPATLFLPGNRHRDWHPRQSGDRHHLNFIKWAGVWGSLPVQDLSSSDCLTTIAIAPAYAGVRIPSLCCDTAQIASALSELALGTGCSIYYVIFMPHSEKRNYHSVKASFLCLFSILDENKRVSLSFDLCHFLTDTFRMLTSI